MTIAYWCVLAACLLPYIFVGLAKSGCKSYNNHSPRESVEKLKGWHKRAYWAHLNLFEGFPAFAVAVLIAHQSHAVQANIDNIALAFVSLRVAYGVFYIIDKASLRSLVWLLGLGCVVSLFFIS